MSDQTNGNISVETGDDIDTNWTGIMEFEIGPIDECACMCDLLLITWHVTWYHIRIHKWIVFEWGSTTIHTLTHNTYLQVSTQWITSWNAMASTALCSFFYSFIHCFCCVTSLDSVFSCVCANAEIWPSLWLVLPRTFSNHERRDKKTERGPLIWVKCCCNWNLIQTQTCAPLRTAFYMPHRAYMYMYHIISLDVHLCVLYTCQQPHNFFFV